VKNWSNDINAVWGSISKVFLGGDELIQSLLATFLAGGHALLIGPVGSGKTTLAKALAHAVGGTYKRVQMTNETLPSDIIGFAVYLRDGDTRVVKGPIFSNIVLLDELNRAPPRTLSALLEAMQERQVTIDGAPLQLPDPHIVVATMNVAEVELGLASQLPVAVLDRFTSSIRVNYVAEETERLVLRSIDEIDNELAKPNPAIRIEDSGKLVEAVKGVYVSDDLVRYIFDIVGLLRRDARLMIKLSTRAPISIYKLARAFAFLGGRNYAIPDDVKAAARLALPHRLIIRPEYGEAVDPINMVEDALNQVKVPVLVQ
jgi:MoxR-like ATPase